MQDRRVEMMKIWMLQTKKVIGFDVYDGFVVRAESSRKARE